jgi:DNA-binding XRE family transcriptional regulator
MSVATPMSDDHLRRTPFGQLLRSLRTKALLSQEQLAQRSGLGVRTIRDLEGGRVAYPRGKSVRLLAAALGLVGAARQAFEETSRASMLAPVADQERPVPVALPVVSADPFLSAGSPGALHATGRGRHREPRAAAGWTVPAHLPMDTPVFAGRAAELAQLDALLADDGPTVVAALWGGPGVGKTTLAVHWAHRVTDRFPDGQLYVDLHGFDKSGPLSPSDAIRSMLGALGVPADQVPSDLHAQACLYRSVLHGRKVFVLLDNARDVEQVRPLLPGAPGCLVAVTSRKQLTGLIAVEGATPVTVDLLTKTEARELMARRLGRERVLAELAAVDEIIDRCARLPLAMAVFASHTAARPNLPLAARVAELRSTQGSLDAFGDAERRPGYFGTHKLLRTYAAELDEMPDAGAGELGREFRKVSSLRGARG